MVFQFSENLVVHIYTWYKEYFFLGLHSEVSCPMQVQREEREGVLVLAIVKLSKSPKRSKSSLSPLVGEVLVLAMVKLSKSHKTSRSSLSPVVGGVLVLEMVKFSKYPKTSKSSLSLVAKKGFDASLSRHKNFSFR